MKGSLSFGNHVVRNGKTLSLVPFDELILENLKGVNERLVIFFQAFDFFMKGLGLSFVLFDLLDEDLILSSKMIILGLKTDELLLEGLDEELLGFMGDFLLEEGSIGLKVFEDGGIL